MRAFSIIIAAAILSCLGGGCASHRVTLSYVETRNSPPYYQMHAMLPATINGVSGQFAIDTGAPRSCLSMSAVRRCGIEYSHGRSRAMAIGGKEVELLDATNVTVKLAPNFEIHWSRIPVFPEGSLQTNSDFFGLIGYQTLASKHAVLDMKHKTITLTK